MFTISVPGYKDVAYVEALGSPEEGTTDNGFRVRRTFIVDWNDRWLFLYGLMGASSVATTNAGTHYVARNIPIGYSTTGAGGFDPRGNNRKHWLFPTAVETIKGIGRITGANIFDRSAYYEKAEIAVLYETVTYGVISDEEMIARSNVDPNDTTAPFEGSASRFVTRFFQPTAEYLTLPFMGAVWCEQREPPIPIPGSLGTLVPATEVMFLWRQVPARPLALDTHIGSVNDRTWNSFPRGTLLLTSIDLKPYRWFLGQKIWDITYKFKYFQPSQKIGEGVDEAGMPFDTSLDRSGTPLNEYYGHNHFLRYRPGDRTNWIAPVYSMMTHNGMRPKKHNTVGNIAGTIIVDGQNIQLPYGQAVYGYKDFNDLFRMTDAREPNSFLGA